MVTNSKSDVMFVCSVGGHLTQTIILIERMLEIKEFQYNVILNDEYSNHHLIDNRVRRIFHAERNIWQILNIIQAFRLLYQLKPKIIISTGAAPGVIFTFVGKYFFGSKTIFIESISRVKTPSLSAKLAYRFVDKFYYQWKSMNEVFPRGTYKGKLI